ncbi:hypothetical protein E2C01_000212 [Portunus trituberculatus]|uniref:Uncharacterized protein n=1 Tax=Portunus trituberculatus TaxID=210409 RepID=A0A5B7CEJ8_PORTR|nr:hypothetical protein [Portunus trituberculatus]
MHSNPLAVYTPRPPSCSYTSLISLPITQPPLHPGRPHEERETEKGPRGRSQGRGRLVFWWWWWCGVVVLARLPVTHPPVTPTEHLFQGRRGDLHGPSPCWKPKAREAAESCVNMKCLTSAGSEDRIEVATLSSQQWMHSINLVSCNAILLEKDATREASRHRDTPVLCRTPPGDEETCLTSVIFPGTSDFWDFIILAYYLPRGRGTGPDARAAVTKYYNARGKLHMNSD